MNDRGATICRISIPTFPVEDKKVSLLSLVAAPSSTSNRMQEGFLRSFKQYSYLTAVFLFCSLLHAAIFGKIQGIVHDPQHRPVAGASVTLKASLPIGLKPRQTSDNGEFSFATVPIGDYQISVSKAGFDTEQQTVTVASNSRRYFTSSSPSQR